MPLPVTLKQIAENFATTPEMVQEEMGRLGVPVFSFLGHQCVYEADIHAAHHRVSREKDRADRVGHVQRVLGELSRMGCIAEPLKMDTARQIDCYLVRHREGGQKEIGIKVQVVSHIHRGGGIHFNVGTSLLRDKKIDWVIMVAPPFAPDTDFLIRRDQLVRQARARGYLGKDRAKDKVSFPKRITARYNRDPVLKTDLAALLPDLGVGVLAAMRAAEAFDAELEAADSTSSGSTKAEKTE